MSESESFIEEVSGELRRDRLFSLFRRYGWIVVLAVLLLVGGAAWNEWRKAQERTTAEARGDAVLGALALEDADARIAALSEISAEGDFARIVTMLKAAEYQAEENPKEAAVLLLSVYDDVDLPRSWRELAGLKVAMLGDDALEAARLDGLLEELAQPGAPFAALAMEQQIYVLIERGENEAALEAAEALIQEVGVSNDLQERLSQVIVALGGSPAEG